MDVLTFLVDAAGGEDGGNFRCRSGGGVGVLSRAHPRERRTVR